jgi:hypothetical protein
MRTRVAYELIADSVFRITVLCRLLLHLETLQYGNILAISLAIHTTSSKPEKTLLLILSQEAQARFARARLCLPYNKGRKETLRPK